MKFPALFFLVISLIACSNSSEKPPSKGDEPTTEAFFVELGGEEQYVEIISTSMENPLLLFVHGGPAWPQTPQIRYFNADLAKAYTVVIWEQRGAGKNFAKNPKPDNLNLEQIVSDGIELSVWLKEVHQRKKIYLAGYSWGSLVGVEMTKQAPRHFKAYFGIAQFINSEEGMTITRQWLREQATERNDAAALAKVDSLENPANYRDEHTRFFNKYLLVN